MLLRNTTRRIGIMMFWLLSMNVYAQHGYERLIKKYGVTEGLSQAVVNSITQDKKGLMWFATDDGFNRFDGYSFQAFRFDCQDTRFLHDNFVQRIFNDRDGDLWVSSRQGMYRFDLSTEQLFPFIDSTGVNRNDVSFITEEKKGHLWVAWYWGGFGLFDKKTKQYTAYNEGNLPLLTSTATIVMHEDTYGLLWVGSQDKGLNVFESDAAKIMKRRNDLSSNDILPSLYIKCFQEDHFGNIWIGTTQGLVVYARRDNRFHVVSAQGELDGKPVFSLKEDSDKTLWIGTRGHGLYAMSLKNYEGVWPDKLTVRQIGVVDRYDISHHTILSIFEDNDKNIWLGTHGDGIFMIGNAAKKFTTIQTKIFSRSAERYVPYHGLCNDSDGNIWAGTDGEGIFQLNRNGEVIRRYTAGEHDSGLETDVFFTAYRDHEENLWFGSYSDG
ncbi:MAG TPA: two-component regulator propeller domain-containing protein, partial [Ohtaekwangia sp.]|nr:two-component regulator propeller domain-containing protein [Ohtaekwangia sp.]